MGARHCPCRGGRVVCRLRRQEAVESESLLLHCLVYLVDKTKQKTRSPNPKTSRDKCAAPFFLLPRREIELDQIRRVVGIAPNLSRRADGKLKNGCPSPLLPSLPALANNVPYTSSVIQLVPAVVRHLSSLLLSPLRLGFSPPAGITLCRKACTKPSPAGTDPSAPVLWGGKPNIHQLVGRGVLSASLPEDEGFL